MGEIVERERFLPLPFKPRGETSDASWFRGPLGLWPWPLVNLILALAEGKRARGYPVVPERRRRMTLWDIARDSEGRIISILEKEVAE